LVTPTTSTPGDGPLEEGADPGRRDPPVRLQVTVNQDQRPRLGGLDGAGDRLPLPPVPQEVDIDGGPGGDRGAEGGQGPAVLPAAEEVRSQLTGILEHVLPPQPAHGGGPGHVQLEAAGVGHEGLAAVDGPHVGGCVPSLQGQEIDGGLEEQSAAGRIGQRVPAAGEQLRQTAGGNMKIRNIKIRNMKIRAIEIGHDCSLPPGCDGEADREA
jgi:hypothetical protein